MKHTLVYIATLCLLLTACQQEELPQGAQALGYLSLSAVEVKAGDVQLISTRAEDDEPLIVELLQGEEVKYSETYTEGMTISCVPGSYTVQVRSESYGTANANAPKYYGKYEETVVVEEGLTTPMENPIEVSMTNFGVTFNTEGIEDGYFSDYSFSVTYNNVSRDITEGETAYFDVSEGTLSYTLSAKNTDNEDVNTEGSYGDEENETIAAGTIYTVTYSLATRSLEVE